MTDETQAKLEELSVSALMLLRKNATLLADLKIDPADVDAFIKKKEDARPRAKFSHEASKALKAKQIAHDRKKINLLLMSAPPS